MTKTFPAAVIFDLDGTLVDSAFDLTGALNHVLEQEGRARVSVDSVRHMVGRGAKPLMESGMIATGAPATESDLNRMLPAFLEYYSAHVADETQIFPGVVETLTQLKDADVMLGVCTNKPIKLAEQLLNELDLSRFFGSILGGDSRSFRKPDPRHIIETVKPLNVSPADAVMIGDSIHDISAAKAVPMPVVAVTFGYSETAVAELNPDAIISHYADLPETLMRLQRQTA